MGAVTYTPRRNRDRDLELALLAMQWVMGQKDIPHKVRLKVAAAHTALHACRSPERVREMEVAMGLAE